MLFRGQQQPIMFFLLLSPRRPCRCSFLAADQPAGGAPALNGYASALRKAGARDAPPGNRRPILATKPRGAELRI
jgi:hypothetical protein